MNDELFIDFGAPVRQSRVTVAFRWLLAAPHVVVLLVMTLVAIPLVVVGWFAALILGRLPEWIADYMVSLIAYSARVNAYQLMLAREFPPFSFSVAVDYPVKVEIQAARLSRLKVFLRLLLAIPAHFIAVLASGGLVVLSPVIWLVTLVLGRMPKPLFTATSAAIRYQARYSAYMGLVTDVYPRRLFGDDKSDWAPEGFRLSRSRATEVVTGLMLALGAALLVTNYLIQADAQSERNAAVTVANQGLDSLESTFFMPSSHCHLQCEEAHEHALGEAYFRFASDVSRIPFPRQQLAQVVVLVHHARQMGQLMLAVSKSKDGGRAEGIDPSDFVDSPLVDAFDAERASVLGVNP